MIREGSHVCIMVLKMQFSSKTSTIKITSENKRRPVFQRSCLHKLIYCLLISLTCSV